MDNKIILYINTIKHLKPSQIYYRLSNRLKRELYKKKLLTVQMPYELKVKDAFNYLIPELDFSKEYLDRFDTKGILNNKFTFINITNQVELSKAWNNKELQHLWRYNLHYFEYLFKLAYEYSKGYNQNQYYNKFKDLIKNWIENNPFAYGDGWHSYTISLRITNWISTYQIFKGKIIEDDDFDKSFRESMYWDDIISNSITLKKQNEKNATEWSGRKPEDGEIFSSMTMDEADKLVRAVTHPYPGAFYKDGEKTTRIWAAKTAKTAKNEGEIKLSDGYLIPIEYVIEG